MLLNTMFVCCVSIMLTMLTYVVIKQNISTSVSLYISGTDKDDVEAAWVLVGGQGSLSCHVKPEENPQEQIATVLWYRGTQGEPIFT